MAHALVFEVPQLLQVVHVSVVRISCCVCLFLAWAWKFVFLDHPAFDLGCHEAQAVALFAAVLFFGAPWDIFLGAETRVFHRVRVFI